MRTKPPFKLSSAIGLSRGATGTLVEELQNILRQFGYLQIMSRSQRRVDFGTISQVPLAILGNFDDATATALKKYQEFYRLPATGILDKNTLTKLAQPRCGVPDLPYLRSKVAAGKWNKQTILFKLNNYTPDLPQALTRNAVLTPLLIWSGFTNLEFREAKEKEKVDVNISFETGNHGDDYPFDGPGFTLAHANYPGNSSSQVHFDEDETWAMHPPGPGSFDLFAVALHEFGHTLGLSHSSDPQAVMYAYYNGQRCLTLGDIQSIQDIYGYSPRLSEFTSFTSCKPTTGPYVWAYRGSDGVYSILRIGANGASLVIPSYCLWDGGFTQFSEIELNGKTYVWAYRPSDGKVCIHEMNSGGAGFTQKHSSIWDTGFSASAGFELSGKAYVWAYRASDGKVCIHEINNNGAGFTQKYMYIWDRNFSGFAGVELNGKAYIWAYRASDGTVCIHEINNNGAGFTQKYIYRWDTGFSGFTGFELSGNAYVWAYRASDGTVCIHEINNNGAGFTQKHMATWDTGFGSFTAIDLGTGIYVCALRGGDALVCIHKITSGGTGFTQAYMSQI